jgi:transposase
LNDSHEASRHARVSIVELLSQLAQHDKELAEAGRQVVDAQTAELQTAQAKAAELEKKFERAAHEREEYRKLYELATLELERLRRHISSRKSERMPEGQLSFDQLAALVGALKTTDGAASTQDTPAATTDDQGRVGDEKKKRKPTGRQPLPEHLPVETIMLMPAELQGPERDAYECIGEEVSETLEHRSASKVRVRVVRPKFARKGESAAGVITAPPLEMPIDKGLAGPGLLAQVIIDKYEDHQGLNRQERRFEREGLHLSDSTLGGWVESLHTLCDPLVLAMCADAKQTCPYIATDATGVLVMAKEQCRNGHFFVLLGAEKHVLFRYSKEHTSAAIQKFLAGYQGYIVADAHSIYEALYRNGCVEVACMAHARRYFYKALDTDPERARVALSLIGKLFKIERDVADAPRAKRERTRQDKSRPILDALFAWCEQERDKVLDQTPISQAIRYALNQRAALSRFVDDGRLPISNNDSERALRQLVIGRRNWLFVGSDEGGHRAATFVSLIASAKLHGLEPYAYLRDLFCLLPGWPRNAVIELAPAYFKQTLEREDVQQRLRDNVFRRISLAEPLPEGPIYIARP